jgi:hypothetical protein
MLVYDYDVLQLLSTKGGFLKYSSYIKEHTLQPETVKIITVMKTYYDKGHSTVDWLGFTTFFWSHPSSAAIRPSDTLVYATVFSKMQTYTLSIEAEDLLARLVECDYAAQIKEACDNIIDGSSSLEDVEELVTGGLRDVGRFVDLDSLFATPDVSAVCTRVSSSGYNWRMAALRNACGPLRVGDFVVVAARPEVGKTTFLASEGTYLAAQLPPGRPLLWINNEEQNEKVFFRIVQAALGMTTADILRDPVAAMAAYEAIMSTKDRILVTDKVKDVASIESLMREVCPGLIVYDQLDKVKGFTKYKNEWDRLGALYLWARENAKEYGPSIAASQLSDISALDPRKVDMDTLRGSKTDKAGEADVIAIITKDPSSPRRETERFINLAKNKMVGPLDESQRHATMVVNLDPTIARYYD